MKQILTPEQLEQIKGRKSGDHAGRKERYRGGKLHAFVEEEDALLSLSNWA